MLTDTHRSTTYCARAVSAPLAAFAFVLASSTPAAAQLPDPIDPAEWRADDWDAGESDNPFGPNSEVREASAGDAPSAALMSDADTRRLADLLGLDEDQRGVLISLIEDARAEYGRQLVTLDEREADLRMRGFLRSERDRVRAERDALVQERARLGGELLDRVYEDLRVMLTDQQLAAWSSIEHDITRSRTLRSRANFFAETLDPIEFASALALDEAALHNVTPVLTAYSRGLAPLITERNAAIDATVDAGTAIDRLIEASRNFSDEERSRAEADLERMVGDLTNAAVRVYNTAIRIGHYNLRAMDDLRAALPPAARAELDRLVAEFTEAYGREFQDSGPWQLGYFKRHSRTADMVDELEALNLAAGRVHRVLIDPRTLEQLQDAKRRALDERAPELAQLEAIYSRLERQDDDIEVVTPLGEVELERVFSSDDERREFRQRDRALWEEVSGALDEVTARIIEIEQRWVDHVRSLIPPHLRAEVSRH